MKTKRSAILFAITASLLFTAGCEGLTLPGAFGDPPDRWTDSYETESSEEAVQTGKESDSETVSATETMETETETETEEYDFSGAELADFTEIFQTSEYHGFLLEPFASPEDINWDMVLQVGAGISHDATEEEIAAYREATKYAYSSKYATLLSIPEPALAEYVLTHSGVKLDRRSMDLSWKFLKEQRCYCNMLWDYEADESLFICMGGTRRGNKYTLEFSKADSSGVGLDADRVLTFVKRGDDLVMQSCEFLWDKGSDPDNCFPVELVPGDGIVNFITYPAANAEHLQIYLVKDGKCLDHSYLYCSSSDNDDYLDRISEVAFLDFNADGIKDIEITGTSSSGQDLIYLSGSVNARYDYADCYDLEDWFQEHKDGAFTIRKVRDILEVDASEGGYADYKDAYAVITKLSGMTGSSYDTEYGYDLIDCDGDDIPELLVDHPGYRMSLYTFKDGFVKCLMHDWGYGAGGNTGYAYAPGKNVFYNHNHDYAGAIHYEYYMTPREDTEIDVDYYTQTFMFDDADGDGEPSEEELAASEFEAHVVNYFCCIDPDMTEEKIKAAIAEYESYEFEELYGTMSYEQVMKKLGR